MSFHQRSICYLICVFNDQQGLNVTLQSIFKDEPLADILIIDDGSQEAIASPEIPNPFHVILRRLDQNQGLIAALNTGLSYIYAEDYRYIARLDAGDTVEPGRLRAQLKAMDENPALGIVGTQLKAFDEDTGATLFYFDNPVGIPAVSNALKIKNCLAHPSVMIRRDVMEKAGFYDPAFKYAEDYEMWRRLDCLADVDNLREVYVNKEISPHQMTATNRSGSNYSKLRAQIKYFDWADIYCWIGVFRTICALLTPRKLLLAMKSQKNKE